MANDIFDKEEGVGDVEGLGFGVGLAPMGKGQKSMKQAIPFIHAPPPAPIAATPALKKPVKEEEEVTSLPPSLIHEKG